MVREWKLGVKAENTYTLASNFFCFIKVIYEENAEKIKLID